MIKKLVILPLLLMPWLALAGEIIDVKVNGMYCPMCAYGLQSSLRDLTGVKDAKVDYAGGSCRIEMNDGQTADIEAIKKLIIDSGFEFEEINKTN